MIKSYEFLGHSYQIECLELYPQHPSWFSFEDEHEVRVRQWKISPGDVVLDIGAAYGSYALTALACGADYVYAWSPQEASPSEPEIFEKSLALNGWSEKCTVYNSGVYSSTGYLHINNQTIDGDPGPGKIRVESLDDWCARVQPSKIDWVKLDVEGAEVEVLRGGIRTLSTYKPKIQVENHLFKRASIGSEVCELLKGIGYQEIQTVPYHSVSHSVYHHGET